MELKSFQQVIDFAISREEEAIKAYGKMINMAKAPGLEKLLSELQEEEKNHKRLLQNITKERIESMEVKEVPDLKISDYLVEEPVGQEINFQDLLIFAAKKEQKAVELYSDLAKKAETGELKKLFDFLVQQEKSHKLKLEEEYEKQVLEGY
ncbi:MAG: ferritin family protein [Candidatus Aminicenantes bacterium]